MISIKTDANTIISGDTFVALIDKNKNYHGDIDKAIKNGATKIIAEYGEYKVPTLIVKDTTQYLKEILSKNYHKYLQKMTIIGIIGSKDKTTTAYLLYQSLLSLGLSCAYIGQLGFYLDKKYDPIEQDIIAIYTAFMNAYDKGYTYVIMEIESIALSQKQLEGIPFEHIIVSDIEDIDLSYYGTRKNYLLNQQLVFKKLKKWGTAIINNDLPDKKYFLLKEHKTLTFGTHNGDITLVNDELLDNKLMITYTYNNHTYVVSTNITNSQYMSHLLAVITTLKALKVADKYIRNIFMKIRLPFYCQKTIVVAKKQIVLEQINHNDNLQEILQNTNFSHPDTNTVIYWKENYRIDDIKQLHHPILTGNKIQYYKVKENIKIMSKKSQMKTPKMIANPKDAVFYSINHTQTSPVFVFGEYQDLANLSETLIPLEQTWEDMSIHSSVNNRLTIS